MPRTVSVLLTVIEKWLLQNMTSRSTKPISTDICLSMRALNSWLRIVSASSKPSCEALQRLRVSRQGRIVDLGDAGAIEFGDQPAFGIGAQIFGSAGLCAETETIEGDQRLARLIGSQCH